jgi:acylglycerol lipase
MLGHSMGALVAAAYVAEHPDAVSGLVLSAPAVLVGSAFLESASRGEGVPPEAISRDPLVVRAYCEDPLVFADQVGPDLNAAAVEAAIRVNERAADITVPVLICHGDADTIADIEGSHDLLAALGSTDKRLIVYEGLYHEILNEPEQDRVLDDIVAWLDGHRPD